MSQGKRERSLNDDTSLNQEKKQFTSDFDPFQGKHILERTTNTAPPQVNVVNDLIVLDHDGEDFHGRPVSINNTPLALGDTEVSALDTVTQSTAEKPVDPPARPQRPPRPTVNNFNPSNFKPTMTSSINVTPPLVVSSNQNLSNQQPVVNPPPQQRGLSSNKDPLQQPSESYNPLPQQQGLSSNNLFQQPSEGYNPPPQQQGPSINSLFQQPSEGYNPLPQQQGLSSNSLFQQPSEGYNPPPQQQGPSINSLSQQPSEGYNPPPQQQGPSINSLSQQPSEGYNPPPQQQGPSINSLSQQPSEGYNPPPQQQKVCSNNLLQQPIAGSDPLHQQPMRGTDTDPEPSFKDFVAEMRTKLDRNYSDTRGFMESFSQELARTNKELKQYRQEALDLTEVVTVQGDRICKLEADIRELTISSAARQQIPPEHTIEQERLLYDINSIKHIPADYVTNVVSTEEQAKLMKFCMEQFPLAKLEGAETAPGYRRYVLSYGVGYGYSNVYHPANPIPRPIEDLRVWMSQYLGEDFNQCSATFYEPEAQMPRHGDREASLVPGSKIAALSLNDEKIMAFFRRGMSSELGRVTLIPGSLVVMRQEDQQDMDHAILPGTAAVTLDFNGMRVSLVFRRLKQKRPIMIRLLGDSNYVDTSGKNEKINFGVNKGQLGSLLPGESKFIPHTGLLPNIGGCFEGCTELVLGVGTNNLKFPHQEGNAPEQVLGRVASFCDALLESKKEMNIFLPEVLPTRDPALIPVVEHYNKLLGEYAAARRGRVTVISTAVFRDNQGLLDSRLSNNQDNLHLNSKGVSLLAGRIKYEIKSKYGLQLPPHLAKNRPTSTRPITRKPRTR